MLPILTAEQRKERKREQDRQRKGTPEYRANQRQRYASDPEYRAKKIARARLNRARERELFNKRYASDPTFRARKQAQNLQRKLAKHLRSARAFVAAQTFGG
jgi:hypothetical protein